jgi:hypothetical protein
MPMPGTGRAARTDFGLRYSEVGCSRLFSMDHTIPPAIATTVTASTTISTFASSNAANKRRSGPVPVSTMPPRALLPVSA